MIPSSLVPLSPLFFGPSLFPLLLTDLVKSCQFGHTTKLNGPNGEKQERNFLKEADRQGRRDGERVRDSEGLIHCESNLLFITLSVKKFS